MRTFNICFHGIGTPQRVLEPGEDRYWIGAALYGRILDEIAGRPDVRLSFDDGNVSDVEIGLPGLRQRGLTATFFALAGRLGSAGSLDAQQLRELRHAGMTIGSHGWTHRPWRGMDAAGLDRELIAARAALAAAAGAPVDDAALPLGRYDRRVLHRLRAVGYRTVHSSDRCPARAGAWLQPRFSVHADDTIDSIRATMLTAPALRRRVRGEVVGVIKRLR